LHDPLGNGDSSAGIVTRIRAGRRFLAGASLFSSKQHPTDFRSTLLLSECKGLCNLGTEIYHSSEFSMEVKNT
jgi:hypothetical protein